MSSTKMVSLILINAVNDSESSIVAISSEILLTKVTERESSTVAASAILFVFVILN